MRIGRISRPSPARTAFLRLFGLFRTDADSERHRGLSFILVPLDTPGVTTINNGVLKFDSLFNTVVNFSALFAGAYFANVLARSYQLPGIDSMVMVAISANAGMAVAALFLMIYYRTSFN